MHTDVWLNAHGRSVRGVEARDIGVMRHRLEPQSFCPRRFDPTNLRVGATLARCNVASSVVRPLPHLLPAPELGAVCFSTACFA